MPSIVILVFTFLVASVVGTPLDAREAPSPPGAQVVDTLRLPVAEAFERSIAAAPEVLAAQSRADAALARSIQTGRLRNPGLSFEAENVGQQRRTTGFDGIRGVEGQIVLSPSLPFGPSRSGGIGLSRAQAAAAQADASAMGQQAAESILSSFAELARATTWEANARLEVETLTELSRVLSQQAAEGRASTSDASRALLARGVAATELARRQGDQAQAVAEVLRRAGLAPDDWIELEIPMCGMADVDAGTSDELPEVVSARAAADAARYSVDVARGVNLPDFAPGIGLRRAQGANALFLSFSTTLPVFDLGGARVDAAQSEVRAAEAELNAVELRLAAERVAARRSLEAVEAAGVLFDADWRAAVEQAAAGAELRYELGEGTLFELLDSRRARLEALDDFATWQADWWRARIRLARLSGATPDPALLCAAPFVEN